MRGSYPLRGFLRAAALWSARGLPPLWVAQNAAPCGAPWESGGKPPHSKALRRGETRVLPPLVLVRALRLPFRAHDLNAVAGEVEADLLAGDGAGGIGDRCRCAGHEDHLPVDVVHGLVAV